MRRFICVFVVVAAWGGATAPAVSAQDLVLRRPVDAPVLDPFRAPSGPYGAGNRGIEYDTDPGDAVVAAAAGVVVFAGSVAGDLHITVDHGGGFRTSYSFVEQILVTVGDHVTAGERLAIAGPVFHFGARDHGVYVDPEPLFGRRTIAVRLVAHEDEAQWARWLELSELSERQAFLDHVENGGGGWSFWDVVSAVVELAAQVPGPWQLVLDEEQRAALVHWLEVMHTAATNVSRHVRPELLAWALYQAMYPPPCTPAGVVARRPPGRRIAVRIAGLDSSSDGHVGIDGLDLDAHGYATDDQVRFSYGGGLIDGDGGEWAQSVESSQYAASDTRSDIEPLISELAETLAEIAAANPGVPIDVYGHSLGGVLARHAIAQVDLDEVPVDVAMTFASPHGGAPAAEFVEAVEVTAVGTVVAEILQETWPDHVMVAPMIEDLSESGFAGDTAAVAFPDGVHAVTVGARADYVVPATMADAPGASHVIVGGNDPVGAHGALPGHPDVAREVALALAGMAPGCSDLQDRLLDVVVPTAIETAEHAAITGVLWADLPGG